MGGNLSGALLPGQARLMFPDRCGSLLLGALLPQGRFSRQLQGPWPEWFPKDDSVLHVICDPLKVVPVLGIVLFISNPHQNYDVCVY